MGNITSSNRNWKASDWHPVSPCRGAWLALEKAGQFRLICTGVHSVLQVQCDPSRTTVELARCTSRLLFTHDQLAYVKFLFYITVLHHSLLPSRSWGPKDWHAVTCSRSQATSVSVECPNECPGQSARRQDKFHFFSPSPHSQLFPFSPLVAFLLPGSSLPLRPLTTIINFWLQPSQN